MDHKASYTVLTPAMRLRVRDITHLWAQILGDQPMFVGLGFLGVLNQVPFLPFFKAEVPMYKVISGSFTVMNPRIVPVPLAQLSARFPNEWG